MPHRRLLALLALGFGAAAARADSPVPEYDRLDGAVLKRLIASDAVVRHTALDPRELALLPSALPGLRVPVLMVRTDLGNFARVLASHALRQPSQPDAAPLPIVMLERFETFEPGLEGKRTAQERERVLFPGFEIDLDSGQIVPSGCGGDLTLRVNESGRPVLVALEGSELFSLARNPFADKTNATRTAPGRQVRPADFAGSYRFVANGQWTGDLELEVDDTGHATGRYRSDQTGAVYSVRGQTARAPANQIELTMQFPRSELVVTGWLWTEGKAAFAGTARLADRPFGFVAIRRGAALSPDTREVGLASRSDDADLSVEVDREGRVRRDGQVLEADALRTAVNAAGAGTETVVVRLGVDPDCPYQRLVALLATLQETGPVEFRLGPLSAKSAAP
jgi:hypothetical protein